MRATRRHWWLVLAAVVAALTAAGLATALAVPQYATSVTFFVTTPSQAVTDSYTGGLFSQQRVKSYADLLTSERLATAVARGAGVGRSAPQIQASVTARPIPDTVLLQATVTDRDPKRSERVSAALAEQFIVLVQALETPPGSKTPTVKVEVVAGPLLDPTPVSPRPARNLAMAVLLGLMTGVGSAILREALDVTVKTGEALAGVTGAPTLAVIPFEAAAKRAPLTVAGATHSARAESLRHLRTNLQFVDAEAPVRVLVVTSSLPNEGKSTTAVNLAIACAEAGQRVLLVEADLRRPRVADYLGLEGAVGLSNVLAGQVCVDEVVQRWGPNELSVLLSGFIPPNPSELLGSRRMGTLLEQLRERYQLVIIDTPPLLPVTDAAVVAAKADGAVLVVRYAKTSHSRVRAALASLRAVDSRVLGCVLSMQRTRTRTEYYHYYDRGTAAARRRRWKPASLPRDAARHPAPAPAGADTSPATVRSSR